MNQLYYGDNLDILRRHVDDESVDLVYLDPPFKSDQDYNVLVEERDGSRAASQIKAFEDTWTWDQAAARAHEEIVESGGDVARAMIAFRTFLGESDMLAYLSMMAPRLVELKRVLKPDGSIYLHCDPTASHYLKMLMADLVLDPFCGCGTTIIAAQNLNRRWVGIDITNLAITLVRSRLTDTFGGTVEYEVIGEPVSLPDAAKLAADDPYQFQWWALGLVGARPVEEKKGADKGIDGRIYFHVGDGVTRQIVLSVKAGHVNVSHVRDLRGVMDREHAEMAVLISLEEPTGPMRKEAASAGFYASPWGKHAKLQLITVEDLLTGKTIDRPPIQTSVTFKRAPKATPRVHERRGLDFDAPEPDQPF